MVLLAASAAMAVAPPAANTAITNTATLNYNDANNAAQPTQTASVTVYVQPVWGVTLTPAPGSTTANTDGSADVTVSYALTVTNTGNATDTFALSYSNSGTFTPSVTFYSDATLATPIVGNISLTSGTPKNVWMAVVVPKASLDGTSCATTATVTGNGSITLTDNSVFPDTGVIATGGALASGVYTTTVAGHARIPSSGPDAATKTNLPVSPTANTVFTYTITMKNDGTVATTDLLVTDALPTHVTYPADSSITLNGSGQLDSSDWNSGTKTITVNIGSLAPGATATITFHAKADAAGSGAGWTNTANITYTGTGSPVNPSDLTVVSVAPNLSLTKVVKNAGGTVVTNIAPGQKLFYTVTVSNAAGAGTATAVSISDSPDATDTTWDANLNTAFSGGASGSSATYSGGIVSVSGVSIPAGGSMTITYDVTVK